MKKYQSKFKENRQYKINEDTRGTWEEFIEWAKNLQVTKRFPQDGFVGVGSFSVTKHSGIRSIVVNNQHYIHFSINSANWIRIYKSEFIYGNFEIDNPFATIYCKNDLTYLFE